MQETYDFYTIIVIFTFLGILIGISFLINKKKDFIKSRLNSNNFIKILSSSLIGGGNKIVLFEVYDKKYFVLINKNNISNITPTDLKAYNFEANNQMVTKNENSK